MKDIANAEVALELLKRYDRPGPRYTSYPTAVEFNTSYGSAEHAERLATLDAARDEPLSLYLHLPFCEERCSFCGCHVVITKKRDVASRYLDYLHRELDLLAERLPHRRRLRQYHWGGGTPTYLSTEEIAALHGKVTEHFTIEPDAEVAIEIDPRVTTRAQVDLLRESGFNRLSMGVQDFTPEVQQAINRRQSEEVTRRIYDYCRGAGFPSINLDLIYGLPLQEPESFARSLDVVLDLRPDRLALYSYAHVPWIRAHQKRVDTDVLPAPDVKLRLFCEAREKLLGAGYVAIGMDHFALPDDELALARADRTLHRNFMGYTVRMGSDMIGAGVSAIGDLDGCFAQNEKKLSTYYKALDDGRFPVERGYVLDRDDRIRRDAITRLMCNFHLGVPEFEARHEIVFADYFAAELEQLNAADGPVRHGFVETSDDAIDVIGAGALFVRNICMIFDRYLAARSGDKQTFSRTI